VATTPKTGEHAADCLDSPVNTGYLVPTSLHGALGRPGLHRVGPNFGRVDTLRCDEVAAIAGGQKQLLSATFGVQDTVCWLPRNSQIRRRLQQPSDPRGWGWCMGNDYRLRWRSKTSTSTLARLHDVIARWALAGGFISRWSGHTPSSNGGRVCGIFCGGSTPALLWSSQRPRKPLPNVIRDRR
jgi:hypothetical protein